MPSEVTEAWLTELFFRLDRNGDGFLQRDELQGLLSGENTKLLRHMPSQFLRDTEDSPPQRVEAALRRSAKGGHQEELSWGEFAKLFGFDVEHT